MVGDLSDSERYGIVFRSVEMIFEQIQILQKYGWNYVIKVAFTEVYNETLRCLIQK